MRAVPRGPDETVAGRLRVVWWTRHLPPVYRDACHGASGSLDRSAPVLPVLLRPIVPVADTRHRERHRPVSYELRWGPSTTRQLAHPTIADLSTLARAFPEERCPGCGGVPITYRGPGPHGWCCLVGLNTWLRVRAPGLECRGAECPDLPRLPRFVRNPPPSRWPAWRRWLWNRLGLSFRTSPVKQLAIGLVIGLVMGELLMQAILHWTGP